MTKQMKDWIQSNCGNCSFRGKDKNCMRTDLTLKDMYGEHKAKEYCPLAEYEEVDF